MLTSTHVQKLLFIEVNRDVDVDSGTFHSRPLLHFSSRPVVPLFELWKPKYIDLYSLAEFLLHLCVWQSIVIIPIEIIFCK